MESFLSFPQKMSTCVSKHLVATFCVNASGKHKMKLSVISKNIKPLQFKCNEANSLLSIIMTIIT
jgi:hypothetical protein